MIDGGLKSAYQFKNKQGRLEAGCLKKKLDELKNKGRWIDLLIVTHVDRDHIGGVLGWFENDFPSSDFVREIWINDDVEIEDKNCLDNSTGQAVSLISLLIDKRINYRNQIVAGKYHRFGWGKILVIAPSETHHNAIARDIAERLNNDSEDAYKRSIKDYLADNWEMGPVTPENDASIALLLQTNEGECDLFLGDANIATVINSIKEEAKKGMIELPLQCKWVKLSHHGSRNNFRPEFLDVVKAEGYIFSTDGTLYQHPDKAVVAQLIGRTGADLYFNYIGRGRSVFTQQDLLDYPGIMGRIKEI